MSFLFCFLAFCVCSAGLILFLAFCVHSADLVLFLAFCCVPGCSADLVLFLVFCVCSADLVLFLAFCVCSADLVLFFPVGDGVVVGVSGGSSFSNNALVLSNKNFIFSFIFLERFLKILSFIEVVNHNNYCSPLSRH